METILRPSSFQRNLMSPNPPSPPAVVLEAHLGFWLRYVSNHVSARFQTLLAERDVSVTEWVALCTLFAQDTTSHAELIQVLGMTKGAASKVISRLEDKGLVQRQLAEGKAREQLLALTGEGRALTPALAALAEANDAHFFAHLPADERLVLMRTLQALVSHHQLKTFPSS